MKQIIIVAVLAVLACYCYGAASCHGTMPVPQYKKVEIDLKGGDEAADAVKNRCRDLERENFLRVPASGDLADADYAAPLKADDFEAVVKGNPAAARAFPVVDQTAVADFANKRLSLTEDAVYNGRAYKAGQAIDRAVLADILRDAKVKEQLRAGGEPRLKVSGHGETIAVQPGTMGMIILIFVALLCALKIILYNPLLKIMDERDEEIAAGTVHQRENAVKESVLDSQHQERRAALRRENQAALAKARHDVQMEAEGMLRQAREEARRVNEANAKEVADALQSARAELQPAVPVLAKQIIDKVLEVPEGGRS